MVDAERGPPPLERASWDAELENALVCAAVRCTWGGNRGDDIKLLAMAGHQVANRMLGTPAFGLAAAAAEFMAGGAKDVDALGRAVLRYGHLRHPAPAAEDGADPDAPTPDPAPAGWAKDYDLQG